MRHPHSQRRNPHTPRRLAATGLLCLLAALAVLAGPAQGQIFYTDGQKLYRADLNGANPQSLGDYSITAAKVDEAGGKIYLGSSQKIQRVNLDGTSPQDIATDPQTLRDLALDAANGKIYWSESNPPLRFRRANLDGKGVENILPDGTQVPTLAIDSAAQKIFYAVSYPDASKGIWVADLNGANARQLVKGVYPYFGAGTRFALDTTDPTGNRIYFVDTSTGAHKLRRVGVDGTNFPDLVVRATTDTSDFVPAHFALDLVNRKIYWAEEGRSRSSSTSEWTYGARIRRADLDGKNAVLLAVETPVPTTTTTSTTNTSSLSPLFNLPPSVWISSLVVSPGQGKVFWTAETMTMGSTPPPVYIRQANLDGSNKVDLLQGGQGTRVIAVLAPSNVAPVLQNSITTASFTQSLVKDVPQLIGNNATVSDADNSGYDKGKVSVSYPVGGTVGDQLSIRNGGSIGFADSTISYGGTAIGRVPTSGTGSGSGGQSLVVALNASATSAVVKALIDNLSYQNSSTSPAASRTIAITVTDSKGGTSAPVSVVITVTPNVAPTLSGVASPVSLGQGALSGSPQLLLNDQVMVDDPDSPDFAGGQLRVTYVSGGTAQDVLTLRDQGSGSGQVGIAEQTASYGGALVGKAAASGVGSGQGGNSLVVDLNGSATPAAVEALIENLQFQHQGTGSATLSIAVTDGDGGTSTAASLVVNVTPNKAPVIASPTTAVQLGQNVMAAEAQRVGLEVSVSDEDSPDFSGGKLTFSYVETATTSERLLFLDGAQVSAVNGRVTFDGVEIGTLPTSRVGSGLAGQTLEVTFNTSATAAGAEALIEALGYQNATPGKRTLQVLASDGDGGTSAAVQVAITITPNAAPQLSNTLTTVEFGENKLNAAAQLLGNVSTLTDEDSPDFGGGKLQVAYTGGSRAEDQLSIASLGTGAGNIGVAEGKVRYGGVEIGEMPISGPGSGLGGQPLEVRLNTLATLQAVRALIDQLSYQNTSDEPASSRTITLVVEDGDGGASAPVRVAIAVKAENEGELVHIIDTVFGGGSATEDGVQAFEAKLSLPYGVFVTPAGEVYIADTNNQKIRKVDALGVITTVAGTGQRGFSGDGGLANRARLQDPRGVFVPPAGVVYIADTNNHRIRKVDAQGVITTVAGTGRPGFSADRGRALQTQLSSPWSVVAGEGGVLYIADTNNHRILLVRTDGRVVAVAGTGVRGFSGDGGRADRARLNSPGGLAVSAGGEIYVADTNNQRIRRISPDGTIVTVAGIGERGFEGDGGAAIQAKLTSPRGVVLSSSGELYIADTYNNRIRRVSTKGVITTVVGTGAMGAGGDLGPALEAELGYPFAVAVTAKGELYIADTFNETIRKTRDILVPNGLSPLLVRAKRVTLPRALVATRGVGIDEEGWLVRGLFGQDTQVGFDDFFLLSDQLGKAVGASNDALFDLDADGVIGPGDLAILKLNFGRRAVVLPSR